MKSLLREYGLIIILIVVAMVGYLVIQGQEEDVLTRSLDGIRNRLVAMVDDVGSREAIAAHFDQFKDKVKKQEVAPEEVESIAANVLNLSNSGSTITPEQAEMMLDFASVAPEVALLPTPEPSPPSEGDPTPPVAVAPPAPPTPRGNRRPEPPPVPVDLTALGERLDVMLAFNAEVEKVINERLDRREEVARHFRYRFEDGLHVDLDVAMTDEMKQRFAREAQRLEARRMVVVWKQNMAEEIQVERERARRELRSVAALKKRPPRGIRVEVSAADLESLESLKRLESIGYRAMLSDSVHRVIMVHLEEALEAAHENLEEALEEAMEAEAEAREDQMEEWEEYLEEVEEALQELEEELHEALEEAAEDDDDEDEDDDE